MGVAAIFLTLSDLNNVLSESPKLGARLKQLKSQLKDAMTLDQSRLSKRLQKLETQRRVGGGSIQAAQRLNDDIEASIARRTRRAAQKWELAFAPELPLNTKLEDSDRTLFKSDTVKKIAAKPIKRRLLR